MQQLRYSFNFIYNRSIRQIGKTEKPIENQKNFHTEKREKKIRKLAF